MDTTRWIAKYSDGTELKQVEGDVINRFKDIDRSRLITFILERGDKPFIVIHLDSNKRLIYRRRVAKSLISGSEQVVYLVGWQEKVEGANKQFLNFLFEDGHIEIVDRFCDGHKWFYPIKFLPEEQL